MNEKLDRRLTTAIEQERRTIKEVNVSKVAGLPTAVGYESENGIRGYGSDYLKAQEDWYFNAKRWFKAELELEEWT